MFRPTLLPFLIGLLFLSACGAESTPTAEAPSNEPPSPTPTETALPTRERAPTEESNPPTPIPTISPTDTPVVEPEIVTESFNPDLDYAQVVFVRATQQSDGLWRFDTTVRHNDQGWDDYADAWQVVDPASGRVLAERILLHPHDNEQPFTRSQDNIEIPAETSQVIVRAKDNVEGFGGQEVLVDLTLAEGENFEVIRE